LEPQDINTIVANAVALLKLDFTRAGVTVALELDATLPPVCVDRIGIEQVITNLLRNANDAMTGMAQQRSLLVQTLLSHATPMGSAQGWVTVTITDAGPGLGGRDIETLTEAFFSTKSEGTGLGLAICRSILESHGGVLQAQDAAGGGACFSFSLPPDKTIIEATHHDGTHHLPVR